jgi:hypothetical protein
MVSIDTVGTLDPSIRHQSHLRQKQTHEPVALPHPSFTILGDWLDASALGCFKFLETAVNSSWEEAEKMCENIGGYLAEPRTRRYVFTVCTPSILVQEIY